MKTNNLQIKNRKNMAIVLTTEEYFEDVCMNCYRVMDFPITFYLPENQVMILCENCSFGVYQCARCHHVVSHLEDTPYREMVYAGPEGTFDDFFIRCRECAYQNLVEDDVHYDSDTDTEEEINECLTDEQTQIIC